MVPVLFLLRVARQRPTGRHGGKEQTCCRFYPHTPAPGVSVFREHRTGLLTRIDTEDAATTLCFIAAGVVLTLIRDPCHAYDLFALARVEHSDATRRA